jgi:hypothetical protein
LLIPFEFSTRPIHFHGQFRDLTVEQYELLELPDATWAEYKRDADQETAGDAPRAILPVGFRAFFGGCDRRRRQAQSFRRRLGAKTEATRARQQCIWAVSAWQRDGGLGSYSSD